MFKIKGVKFKLNLLFLVVLFLFSISGLFTEASLTFLIVLLHELAHSVVAVSEGVKVNEVELLPFGGVVKFANLIQLKPASEIKIALAGPVFNLLLVLVILLLIRYEIILLKWGLFLIRLNLTIGLFNLIPALPLDGGRVLRAKLTTQIGFKKATYQVLYLSKIIAIGVAIIAIIGIYLGKVNIMLLIISFFIYFIALKEKEYTPYLLMEYIAKKKEKFLTEKVVAVEQLVTEQHTPLKDIIERLVPNRFNVILVVDSDLNILGSVTEDKLINALIEEGLDLSIKSLLNEED
ncbi:site-2 protease family protein [Natroniella sulfidigena]|uniref:site-2 protease family protein n=1 Tax=Natroniella sulfidigena TaxID=723921 RepID=UPI00200A8843|nr:site-2 protease family protein [Natroniella sulfidigena]MCK8815877.1 site-2 protease family protein [Natroniella sulfidigena]